MEYPSHLRPNAEYVPDEMEVAVTIDLGDEESPFVTYKRTIVMPADMDDPEWDKIHEMLDTLVKYAENALDAHERSTHT